MLRTLPKTPIASRPFVAAALLAAALGAFPLAGCAPTYEQQRPPVDQLDSRDAGLQSKDVLQASDRLIEPHDLVLACLGGQIGHTEQVQGIVQ